MYDNDIYINLDFRQGYNLDFRQEGEVGCQNKVDIHFLREILHKYRPRYLF